MREMLLTISPGFARPLGGLLKSELPCNVSLSCCGSSQIESCDWAASGFSIS